jgi:dTDP-4-dehydrorhamnose reductase
MIGVFGGSGRVGRVFVEKNKDRVIVASHEEVDITKSDQVDQEVEKMAEKGVRTIINFVGDNAVDAEEYTRGDKSSRMWQVNVEGAINVANASKKAGILLIHIGTEYEFEGNLVEGVYNEKDETKIENNPTWYGETKAVGSQSVLDIYPEGSAVARLSQVQTVQGGLFKATIKALETGKPFTRASNQFVSPILGTTVTKALTELELNMHSAKKVRGVFHISSLNDDTSYNICQKLVGNAKDLISPITLEELVKIGEQKVLRPKRAIMGVKRFQKEISNVILGSYEREIKNFPN